MTLIVVEHMEEEPTRWLVEEYTLAYEDATAHGHQLVVTGVRDPRLQAILTKRRVPWVWEHSWEMGCPEPRIVLDMRARRALQPWEARYSACIIIGGIMGDHPPRGRGLLLVWSSPGAAVRSLGPWQMSVHTAVWAAARVASGDSLENLPLARPPATLRVRGHLGVLEIELPYAYPAGEDGRPMVPERIRRLLERGVMWDEL